LTLFEEEAPAIEQLWDERGIAYELLGGERPRQLLPGVDPGAFFPPKRIEDPAFADDPRSNVTAIFEPESGFMDDPMLCAHNLAYAARQHDAVFRFQQEVVAIDQKDGRVSGVTLASGESISAHIVVN
jgi:sarcosine oxidase, subunit beta